MPQVPYNPVPQVDPQGGNTPNVRVSTPVEAFGGAVAESISHLGSTLEHAGDKLWNRAVALQQLENESQAREADAEFMEKASKAHAEYSSLRGQAAVEGLDGHIANLRTLREGVKSRLTTDQSRKMYDAQTMSFIGRNMFNAASHAATENKRWAAGASEARIKGIGDYVYQQPNDQGALEDGLRLADQEIRGTQAPIVGWSPEQTDEAVKKAQSEMIALRISGLARTNPQGAKELLESYRGRMTPAATEQADKVVISQLRTSGAKMIADKLGAGDLKKPLEQTVEEGKAEAQRVAPDDPVLQDYVQHQIISQHNQAKSLKQDRNFANRQVIAGALVGAKQEGKIPTNLQELFALDPQAQTAWEGLDHTQQLTFMNTLAANAKGDYRWTEKGMDRYAVLKGMARGDADAVTEFLDTSMSGENLPWSARGELVNLQGRIKEKGNDPRVQKAVKDIRASRGAEMEGLGIFNRTEQNKTEYDRFTGAVGDAIDIWQETHKRRPVGKEITEEIANEVLRQQKVPGTVWGRFWPNKYTIYNQPVPQEDIDRFKAKVKGAGGDREPSDEEATRAIIRSRLLELYGGSGGRAE